MIDALVEAIQTALAVGALVILALLIERAISVYQWMREIRRNVRRVLPAPGPHTVRRPVVDEEWDCEEGHGR